MYITSRGYAAVDILIDLAMQDPEPVVLATTSHRLGISISTLEIIFAMLRSQGIVEGRRGTGGGYRLARPADQITVADIILAVAKSSPAKSSNRGTDSGITDDNKEAVRGAHDLSANLNKKIFDYLASVSLKDLAEQIRL